MTNEAWHPFVTGLAQAIAQPSKDGEPPVLLLPEPVLERALTEARALAPDEGELIALHLVSFARALYQRSGDAVRPLVEQLVTVAATALSDPRRLRDAFGAGGAAGVGVDVAALLGGVTSRVPVTRDPSAPSLLDVRLGRAGRTKTD